MSVLELLTDPAAWMSLLTLTVLEIVLGVDNVIFISIAAARLPEERRAGARSIGLTGRAGPAGRAAVLASPGSSGCSAPFLTVAGLRSLVARPDPARRADCS